MPTKKEQTINQLIQDGQSDIARKVKDWKSVKDNNWGWDRWFATKYAELAKRYNVGQKQKT